jgi:CRP/FNR family transcriptional regulator, cyclic AMP receptor protein
LDSGERALKVELADSPVETVRAARWAIGVEASHLERVLRAITEYEVPAGNYVCRKGEPVNAWLGVVSGLVKLGSVSPEGKMVTYTGITAGGWFGEGSLLKSELRRYDAVALRDTRVAAMPRPMFQWLLSNSIPFNRFILDQLNERLAQMIALLDGDRLRDPEARVAQCLASLFNAQLYPSTDSHLQISQEEIGHLSGLSRQRVNHALHVLQQAGLLRVEHIGITIVDLDGLRGW